MNNEESQKLAKYAVTEYNSRGRLHAVRPAKDRNAFQRDYTRILHSQSFRKLQGKTQVFPAEYNDLRGSIFNNIPLVNTYRTRMSHSFEVEQVARSIGRALHVNEDLCATLAIGHDIGHPPFGHTGQDVLNKLFKKDGGFEHNMQALHIVDKLECPYIEYDGLNLMFETREGLLKHCSIKNAKKLGAVAQHHIDGTSPTLEAQIVDMADQLAYLHGDLEDAVDKNILSFECLMDIMPGFKNKWKSIFNYYVTDKNSISRVEQNKFIKQVFRELMSESINDVILHSRSQIELYSPQSLDEIRTLKPLISLSEEKHVHNKQLRLFSRQYIYGNKKIKQYRKEEEKALISLYEAVNDNFELFNLPDGSSNTVRNWLASQTDQSVMTWWQKSLNLKHRHVNAIKNKNTSSDELHESYNHIIKHRKNKMTQGMAL